MPHITPATRSPIEQGPSRRLKVVYLLIPTIVLLLTFSAFVPVLENGFVSWDDDSNLIENPHYRGLDWPHLRWMFTTFHMSLYRPLTWVSWGFDYWLWGMEPLGYHLTSLVVHAINALLVYLIAGRLLALSTYSSRSGTHIAVRMAAAVAALIFSLHPLRVEAVAWVSARNDLLSGLFSLLTVLWYLRAAAPGESPRRRAWSLTASVLFYALSLLSKGSMMTLPIVLLVLDVYPLRRLRPAPSTWFTPACRRVWIEKIPFLLLAAAAAVLAVHAKEQRAFLSSLDEYGSIERAIQATYGLAFYLCKTLLPVGLSPIYQIPAVPFDLGSGFFLMSAATVIIVSGGLVALRKRWPAGLASWICYIVILVPVLGIVQFGPQFVADRYSYMACLPWAILAGSSVTPYWHLANTSRLWIGGGIAGAILAVWGTLAWNQTQVWRDSETLWRHALAADPQSPIAHNSLGSALAARGQFTEAMKHFRKALELNPKHVKAYNNLGVALVSHGQLDEAAEAFRTAVTIDSQYAEAYYNLGHVLASQGELDDSIQHFRRAVEINPAYAKAYYSLGNVFARQGKMAEAAGHYRQAIAMDPDHAKAYVKLGAVLISQGAVEQAIEYFRHAIHIEPDSADAHENLGRALAAQGKTAEAAKHYEQALRILRTGANTSSSR
jgi:tetratricopeptide (TPR) repeat protein